MNKVNWSQINEILSNPQSHCSELISIMIDYKSMFNSFGQNAAYGLLSSYNLTPEVFYELVLNHPNWNLAKFKLIELLE